MIFKSSERIPGALIGTFRGASPLCPILLFKTIAVAGKLSGCQEKHGSQVCRAGDACLNGHSRDACLCPKTANLCGKETRLTVAVLSFLRNCFQACFVQNVLVRVVLKSRNCEHLGIIRPHGAEEYTSNAAWLQRTLTSLFNS